MVTDGGFGGYEAFPDVCRLSDGRIMGTFYAGYAHVSPANSTYPNGGACMKTYSADEGATWSTPEVLYDGPLDDRDSSLYQKADGQLICNCFNTDGVWLTRSNDLGNSWTPPSLLDSYPYYCTRPIRRLSTGRLIMGLYYATASTAYGAVVLSDDDGDSWSSPIAIPTPVRLDAETEMIELKDGTLWAAERSNTGQAYFSTSSDFGETWSFSQPLGFTCQAPYLFRYGEDMILLGYRGYNGGQGFTALRYSLDECDTWSDAIVIDSVMGAYTSFVTLEDGSVLVAYHENNNTNSSNIRVKTIGISGVSTPEPSSLALLVVAAIGLSAYVFKKRK